MRRSLPEMSSEWCAAHFPGGPARAGGHATQHRPSPRGSTRRCTSCPLGSPRVHARCSHRRLILGVARWWTAMLWRGPGAGHMEALRPSRQDDAPTTIPSDLRAYKELQRPSLGPCRREEAAALRRPLSHGASGDFHRQEPCSLHTRDAVSSPWVQWQASRSSPCLGDILEPWQRDPRLRRRRSVSTEAVMALTTDRHACAPLAAQAFHDRQGGALWTIAMHDYPKARGSHGRCYVGLAHTSGPSTTPEQGGPTLPAMDEFQRLPLGDLAQPVCSCQKPTKPAALHGPWLQLAE